MLKKLSAIFVVGVFMYACAPTTFIKTVSPNWNTIEIRDNLSYDQAWKSIVDLIAQKIDIETISKESGYIRSGWYHAWTGELDEAYKVRVMVKFTPDRKKVSIKSEAQHYSPGFLGAGKGWVMGTDERLITSLRTDITGKVGRVAR